MTIKCKPKAPGYANTKDSAHCYRNANCPKASDIYIRHRIIVTIYEHIMTRDTLPCRCIAICTYKPANNGIIIPTLQVVEPCLLIVHIATVPQRIQLRKLTGRCKNLAPGIVIVVCAQHTIHGFKAYYVSLQVGDVVVDSPVVDQREGRAVGIIGEVQDVVAHSHPHQLIAVVDVVVGLLGAGTLGTQAASLILHGPVTDIQSDRCGPCRAHVAVGIGNEAAVLGTVALRSHLYADGIGGCVTAGAINQFICTGGLIQPLIGQVLSLGLYDKGSNVTGSSVVIVRLVDDGVLRIPRALAHNRGSQLASLRGSNMTHEVLGDTTVLASEVTALNGHIEGFGGFTADVRPCLALILAALPLVSHPVAFCLHGKGGGAAGGAEEVLGLGRDNNRGLLGKSRQLTAILPAKGPAVAVEVAGRISVAVIGNALAVIRGQQILPIGIFVCVGVGSRSVREGLDISNGIVLVRVAVGIGCFRKAADCAALCQELSLVITAVGTLHPAGIRPKEF